MKVWAVLVLLLGVGTSIRSEVPPNLEAYVKDLIENLFLPANNAPGAAIAVVTTDGSFALTRGYGLKDIPSNTPMDDHSLFVIASISKSICATLVSRTLREKFPDEGQGVLDIPIAKLAPYLNFTFIDRARGEQMSFRDLLSHRSCLHTGNFGRMVGAFDSTDDYIFRSRYIPEICPYRTGYNYNNAMFSVAGELIAQINGNGNYTEMLENFLKELGMNNSRVISKTLDYNTLESLSTPYYRQDGKFVRSNPNLIRRASVSLGSGGVISSASDMTRYLQFQLGLGKLDGKQIVPASVMQWPRRPANPFNFNGYKVGNSDSDVNGNFAYGLGLEIGFFKGQRMLSHGGFWSPYPSQMSLYPDLNLGIYSSANGPGRLPQVDWPIIHNAIAELFHNTSGRSYEEIKAEVLQVINEPKDLEETHKFPSECDNCVRVEPKDLPGVYGNPAQGDLKIVSDATDPKGDLRMEYGVWGKAYIKFTNNKYLLEWDSDVVSDFCAAGTCNPTNYLNFLDNDSFFIEDARLTYSRNATRETLDPIPWTPGSCAP